MSDTPHSFEQEARDLLDAVGVIGAQDWTAGEIVALANKLDELAAAKAENERLRKVLDNVLAHYSGPDDVYQAARRTLSGEGE